MGWGFIFIWYRVRGGELGFGSKGEGSLVFLGLEVVLVFFGFCLVRRLERCESGRGYKFVV